MKRSFASLFAAIFVAHLAAGLSLGQTPYAVDITYTASSTAVSGGMVEASGTISVPAGATNPETSVM